MDTQTFPQKHAITDVAKTESARTKLQQNREAFQEHLTNLERLGISVCQADIDKDRDNLFCEEMQILYNELLLFLKNASICVYSSTEVHEYLRKKRHEMHPTEWHMWKWVWRPLRASDAVNDSFYRDIPPGENGNGEVIWEQNGEVIWKQYDRMLPQAILYTIEKIAVGFPASRFFVSDFVKKKEQLFASRPDPFLAVAVPRMPFLTVDFWNEPGFHPTQLGG